MQISYLPLDLFISSVGLRAPRSIHWTWLAMPKSASCASGRGDHGGVMAAGVLWLVPATMLVSSVRIQLLVSLNHHGLATNRELQEEGAEEGRRQRRKNTLQRGRSPARPKPSVQAPLHDALSTYLYLLSHVLPSRPGPRVTARRP